MSDTTPDTLTVIMADTHSTYMSLIHENECKPYKRRTVHIKLTEEQRRQLERRIVGTSGTKTMSEELLQCYLETLEDNK